MLTLLLRLPVKVHVAELFFFLEWKVVFLGLSLIFIDTKEEQWSVILILGVQHFVNMSKISCQCPSGIYTEKLWKSCCHQ